MIFPLLALAAGVLFLARERALKSPELSKLSDEPAKRSAELLAMIRNGRGAYRTAEVESRKGNRVLVFKIMAEPLKVGDVYVSLTERDLQKAADALDMVLLTPKMVDLAHEQADLILQPMPQGSWVTDGSMGKASRMLDYSNLITSTIGGRSFRLLSNAGKDWVLDAQVFRPGNYPTTGTPWKYRAANYGWFKSKKTSDPWQGLGHRHDLDFTDYSQLARLADRKARLSEDGGATFKTVSLAEVLTSPKLYDLASYELLFGSRHPGV